jgi:hypothetical protein
MIIIMMPHVVAILMRWRVLQIEGKTAGQEKLAKDIIFAKSRGVATSGDALWLNGQLLRQEGNWRQVLMYYMQVEMQKVQV